VDYVLGVDIGSQGTKGVVLDENLDVVARLTMPFDIPPTWCGIAEGDAEEIWWGAFKAVWHNLSNSFAIPGKKIAGIGCSSFGPCLVPLSAEGRPTRAAMLYSDARARNEARYINKRLGIDRIRDMGRNGVNPYSIAAKLLWLKNHEPESFEKTALLLTGANYIVYKLTDMHVVDYSQGALLAPFYNYTRKAWHTGTCDALGVDVDLLPALRGAEEIAGYVTAKAAEETDLPAGTPVVVSCSDGMAELVSAGGGNNGTAILIYGNTGAIIVPAGAPPPIEDLVVTPHPVRRDQDLVVGVMETAGALTKWFTANFAVAERESECNTGVSAYQVLSAEAEGVPAGSEGLIVIPLFSGERTPMENAMARGLVAGLTLSHTRSHLYRALLEGIAYGFKDHLDLIEDCGISISRIIALGGGSQSDVWVQIVTDVTGRRQFVPTMPTGSDIGAAYLAAIGIGLTDDLEGITARIISDSREVMVNRHTSTVYKSQYEIYQYLHEVATQGTRDKAHPDSNGS